MKGVTGLIIKILYCVSYKKSGGRSSSNNRIVDMIVIEESYGTDDTRKIRLVRNGLNIRAYTRRGVVIRE